MNPKICGPKRSFVGVCVMLVAAQNVTPRGDGHVHVRHPAFRLGGVTTLSLAHPYAVRSDCTRLSACENDTTVSAVPWIHRTGVLHPLHVPLPGTFKIAPLKMLTLLTSAGAPHAYQSAAPAPHERPYTAIGPVTHRLVRTSATTAAKNAVSSVD